MSFRSISRDLPCPSIPYMSDTNFVLSLRANETMLLIISHFYLLSDFFVFRSWSKAYAQMLKYAIVHYITGCSWQFMCMHNYKLLYLTIA